MIEQKEKGENLLFTGLEKKILINNKNIINEDDTWYSIGINYILDPSKKTKWSIECGKTKKINIMVGICAKQIINVKNSHAGQFLYGWVYSSSGHIFHCGRYSNYSTDKACKLSWTGSFQWAPNDVISVEFYNYSLKLHIEDVEVCEWKMTKYPKLDKQELIPVICVNGSSCKFIEITSENIKQVN